MTPIFSIIIPVYNVAPYLRECLDSVLAAARMLESKSGVEVEERMVEIICVDDGSTDGSGEILDEWKKKVGQESRSTKDGLIHSSTSTSNFDFRVLHQQNAGVSAARNAALDVAKGDWVWFVDADDAIHPESLAWYCSLIQRYGDVSAFSFFAGNLVGSEKPVRWPSLPDVGQVELVTKHQSNMMRGFRRGVWATLIRRANLGEMRFDPAYAMGEDVIFLLSYYWKTQKWAFLEGPFYFYRVRPGSAVNSRMTLKAVGDFLRAELELQSLLDANRDKWAFVDNLDFFRWSRDFDWYTLRRMIFDLDDGDLCEVLPLWVKVQQWQHRVLKDTLFRRFIVLMIKWTNSAMLFRCLMEIDGCLHRGGNQMKAWLLKFKIVQTVKEIVRNKK